MATDRYGINDLSLLSGDNAGTARMIQDAFTRSMLAKQRYAQRYNLPQLASFANDNALAQAQTTAGILNNNQQLQHVIDAMNRSPHGIQENLAAYLPQLTAAMRLAPALFGTDNQWTKGGLIPTAIDKVKGWFTDPATGKNYQLDQAGKVVWQDYDAMGMGGASMVPPTNWGPIADYGADWGSTAGDWGPIADYGADWGSMADTGIGAFDPNWFGY